MKPKTRKALTPETAQALREAQRNEITEHLIYARLASATDDPKNRKVLERIAADEKRHHDFFKQHTGFDAQPRRWKAFRFYWISRIFGLTFGIKLMERGEGSAKINYAAIAREVPAVGKIAKEEDAHEHALIGLIEEERLAYMGSVVLGLNDALVELTGTLAGLTFALQNTRLVALAGLITGVAAAFSMAASEYLSTKSEGEGRNALKSSAYTFIAYIFTVIALILPYFFFSKLLVCLGLTLAAAIAIIFLFNFYISVAKDLDFRTRFLEMAAISLGVAGLSFSIGLVIRQVIGIDV